MAKKPPVVETDDDELPVPARRGSKNKRKAPEEISDTVQYWLSEIAAARKREKKYREDGRKIREIYAGDKCETTPFNILFSNTEIISPSLYSQVPRPVVQRRFKDKDPLGMASAEAGKRCLEFLLDTNIEGYETFHEGMKSATLDAILPGRGITSVKYDADIGGTPDMPLKKSELVCVTSRSWDRVTFGYARKWSKVPWVAYEEYFDKAEAESMFGKEVADKIQYTQGDNEDEADKSREDKDTGERKTAKVYQIWDKAGGRKIRYISPHYPDGFLKVSDDTLQLSGFFDIPRPLQFIEKTDDLTPTAPYKLYENQAKELNKITQRINKLIEAMKARGLYDAALGTEVEKLLEGDENDLVPTEKGNSLAAERGLGNAIWFMPLEVLQQTLQQLYVAREQCKQVIYEIMGISDIVRGASKASETLGAQQIKSQWGTLRLKNKQSEVQRYACDVLRMMLEIAASKFSEETWAKMTGLPYLTEQQFAQLQLQMQGMQQQMMQVQQQAQITGQQIPPQAMQQAQQQMQQLQQQLQVPQWSQVIQLLRDDLQRGYRIDIETNSTIEPEAAEDQKNISDLMGAMAQFLQGVGPMVQQGIMPFDVAKTMLMSITRRFRFGQDIEEQIEQMQPPKPQDDGAAQKAQARAAADKLEADKKVAQLEVEKTQLQNQLKATQTELQLIQKSAELDNRERVLNDEEARFKIEKQAAAETITRNAQSASKELDHKKTVVGMEAKALGEKQNVAKTVDSKLADGIKGLQQAVSSIVTANTQLVQAVSSQADQVQKLADAVTKPRRKKAIRGPDGSIVEMVEESVQ